MHEMIDASDRLTAPRWALVFLVLGVLAALVGMTYSLFTAALLFPLFDLTPVVVLGVAAVSRRWGGASARWFSAAMALSVIMLAQWVVWDWWFLRSPDAMAPSTLNHAVNSLSVIYSTEIVLLLILFGVATRLAITAIRQQRPCTIPHSD